MIKQNDKDNKIRQEIKNAFGGLFFLMCDEVSSSDWKVALNQLLLILENIPNSSDEPIADLIKNQVSIWIVNLPCFIKDSLNFFPCEN